MARLQKCLGPESLRHFVALLTVLQGFLQLLRLVNIEDNLAGIAADQQHDRIADLEL